MTTSNSPAARCLADWESYMKQGDPALLKAMLHPDCRFVSPVVFTPQQGRPITMAYLAAAKQVLGRQGFSYLRRVVDGRHAVLEFSVTIDDIEINGVDMIETDSDGKIVEFKVMVRPLQAMNLLHRLMADQLSRAQAG